MGPRSLQWHLVAPTALQAFAIAAFLPDRPLSQTGAPGQSRQPDFQVTLSHAGALPQLPTVHWAQRWILAQQAVPFELSQPYRIHIDRHAGLVSVIDTGTGTGALWLRREVEIDARILVTPFRILLNWLAGLFDASLLHAAAVQVAHRGILLSGPSGSGKSTLALALATEREVSDEISGIVSDDCVLLHDGRVWPVFTRAKVSAASIALIDSAEINARPIPRGHFPKSFIDLRELRDRFVPCTRVESLIFPTLYPLSGSFALHPRAAFNILSEEARRETGGGTERDRIRVARLCAAVPATRLLLADLAEARAEIRGIAIRSSEPPSAGTGC